jgi:signal transduction histidine kinase
LRNRIALLVFGVALGALTIVLGGVVPSLEDALRAQAIRTLAEDARRAAPAVGRAIDQNATEREINRLVRDLADRSGDRVTLLGVGFGDEVFLKSDSTRAVEIGDLRFGVAVEAATGGRPVTGTEAGDAGLVGEAAVPLAFGRGARRKVGSVLVFSAGLERVQGDVAVIRRRLLVATGIALALAGLVGLLVARALTRRVRGLEVAARRVAGGDFTARFPVDGEDELAQLGQALEDMRRQLAELDDARSRFIATASHELRTPIFSLGGFIELLEDEEVPEEDRRRFVAQLRGQVARLSRLATDLLDLSRLESGALRLREERTDLKALSRAVASEFGPALAAHGSLVELRLPEGRLEAVCDPDRVAQVMRILLDNALTHTPPGTDLVVSASRRGTLVRVGVGDFGPGIPRAMLPRIFEPFVTSDDAQGSGLGLAIAHELAERMAGELLVESQPGRTTFTLELEA